MGISCYPLFCHVQNAMTLWSKQEHTCSLLAVEAGALILIKMLITHQAFIGTRIICNLVIL